jgi:hypothetical protein
MWISHHRREDADSAIGAYQKYLEKSPPETPGVNKPSG